MPISHRPSGFRRALVAVPGVVAIVLALWLFVDRVVGAQMRDPLAVDEISQPRELLMGDVS